MPIRLFLLILSVVVVLFSCTNKLFKTANKTSHSVNSVANKDSFLVHLNNRFQLVTGYGFTGRYQKSTDFIIAISEKHCTAYRYEKFGDVARNINDRGNAHKTFRVDSVEIERAAADKFISFLYNEKIWLLKYSDSDAEELPCKHRDTIPKCFALHGATYRSYVAGGQKIIYSQFYAPEFYEIECCPGNKDRAKFLRFKSQIDGLMPSLLKIISN